LLIYIFIIKVFVSVDYITHTRVKTKAKGENHYGKEHLKLLWLNKGD
jgi:isoprenylcysteine carboxyl methyltransferase (ICMT) family protein YpbQ